MYSFRNDYSEGAHPKILNALIEMNLVQVDGYGMDCYTREAIKLLKERIMRRDVDIHLFSGGTQTNLTALSAFLRPHEAIIAARGAHILVHETGAIEATGHKVISVEGINGKLNPSLIKAALDAHTDEHMVKPKLVYISNSTEIGTIYLKRELEQLSSFCRENNLILYVDGARLGSALSSETNDVDMSDLGALVDAFYIGGTKNGALVGEALVICKDSLKEDFRFHMKQKGALLAKGSLIGIQFLELFRENLYFELARHANKMASFIRNEFTRLGFSFLTDSPTNQVFPILPNQLIAKLEEKYSFHKWCKVDGENSSIRLVTSWATKEESVLEFIKDLRDAIKEIWMSTVTGKVMTVNGLIHADEMGITLPHEHLLIFHQKDPVNLTDSDLAAEELKKFSNAGGKTVIDLTNVGIGRDPLKLKEISEITGVHVVMGSGYYKTAWLPPSWESKEKDAENKSVNDIAQEIINDITHGVDGTDIKSGIIGEIGLSIPITPIEEKVLKASALAQKFTGAAINVHWDIEADEDEHNYALDILENEGADLSRVILSHVTPRMSNLDFIERMAQRGCIIEFDLWGHEINPYVGPKLPEVEEQISTLKKLIDLGWIRQLLISQDHCFTCQLTANGGFGYAHILNNVVPQFKKCGITEDQINSIMVENPKRIFPFQF